MTFRGLTAKNNCRLRERICTREAMLEASWCTTGRLFEFRCPRLRYTGGIRSNQHCTLHVAYICFDIKAEVTGLNWGHWAWTEVTGPEFKSPGLIWGHRAWSHKYLGANWFVVTNYHSLPSGRSLPRLFVRIPKEEVKRSWPWLTNLCTFSFWDIGK